MNDKVNEVSVRKGIYSCYGEISDHIKSIVSEQSLSLFCSSQGKFIDNGIKESNNNKENKERVVFDNPSFSECWNELIHEEDVELKRIAKLSRLGNIAAENAVYVGKMRKRFTRMNIVGKDIVESQPPPEEEESSYYDYEDEDDYYDYDDEDDDHDYEDDYYDYEDEDHDNEEDDYSYDDYDYYDDEEEWQENMKEIHVVNMNK